MMQTGRRGAQTPEARAKRKALRLQAEGKLRQAEAPGETVIRRRVRKLLGNGPAFLATMERVDRAMAAGYDPTVRLDARGNVIIEVTAILSEWSGERDDA